MTPLTPSFLIIIFLSSLCDSQTTERILTHFRRRKGGIDVGTHSKRNRTWYKNVNQFHYSGHVEVEVEDEKEDKVDNGDSTNPPIESLKLGIVLPYQIFQQRRYQVRFN